MDSNEQEASVFRENAEQATIPFTDLPAGPPESPLATEWNSYRSQAGRLLTDGKEGKWVLFKGDELIGIYDSRNSAVAEGYRRYPQQDFLAHQVRAHEPILRIRGFNLPCPVSMTQSACRPCSFATAVTIAANRTAKLPESACGGFSSLAQWHTPLGAQSFEKHPGVSGHGGTFQLEGLSAPESGVHSGQGLHGHLQRRRDSSQPDSRGLP